MHRVTTHKIGFIGGGNMARSLIGGLLAKGIAPTQLWVSEPTLANRQRLQEDFGVQVCETNTQVCQEASILLFAVKPQVLAQVAQEIATLVQQRKPLVISIAAGIRTDDVNRWLGGQCKIVRAMPNTPALIGLGATALFANVQVEQEAKDIAQALLSAVGISLWVEQESQLDAVTALSGSGPAYYFLFMEAMQQAAITLGLPADIASQLTLQTALGAVTMAQQSDESLTSLRERVTSPNGTTAAAIAQMEKLEFRALIQSALVAACQRSQELAIQLGTA